MNATVKKKPTLLFIGDCRKALKKLPDNSVHFIVTSPPYFSKVRYSRDTPEDLSAYKDLEEWFQAMKEVWKECFRVLRPGRRMAVNVMDVPRGNKGAWPIAARTLLDCLDIGFKLRDSIAWQKHYPYRTAYEANFPYPPAFVLRPDWENVWVLQKPGTPYYGHITRCPGGL